ncbi:MAG: hypothetical protein Fues2KO_51890 [Fuerstiella sp.]
MASVGKDSKGWRIRFTDQNGRKRSLRPGKVNKTKANQIARHVAELVSAKASGQPTDRQTAAWLNEIGDPLWRKLARAGLVQPRSSLPLKAFMKDHIEQGTTSHSKPAAKRTRDKWTSASTHLNEFFGSRNLRDITLEDAQQFRRFLERKALQPNSVRSVIACAKMFYNSAIRRGLCESNPFQNETAAIKPNRSRDRYVCRETIMKVIESCPDPQWKLMTALWRFAGLRKMEIFELRWSDVFWSEGKIRVRSPKTSHLEGLDQRYTPTGQIEPYLLTCAEARTTDRVIERYRRNYNLHKPFIRIVEAAGLTPWPKLFQNLRASCETDWLDMGFPAHVVADWIGHSVTIQRKHYAQVADHHFETFKEKVATHVATTSPDHSTTTGDRI